MHAAMRPYLDSTDHFPHLSSPLPLGFNGSERSGSECTEGIRMALRVRGINESITTETSKWQALSMSLWWYVATHMFSVSYKIATDDRGSGGGMGESEGSSQMLYIVVGAGAGGFLVIVCCLLMVVCCVVKSKRGRAKLQSLKETPVAPGQAEKGTADSKKDVKETQSGTKAADVKDKKVEKVADSVQKRDSKAAGSKPKDAKRDSTADKKKVRSSLQPESADLDEKSSSVREDPSSHIDSGYVSVKKPGSGSRGQSTSRASRGQSASGAQSLSSDQRLSKVSSIDSFQTDQAPRGSVNKPGVDSKGRSASGPPQSLPSSQRPSKVGASNSIDSFQSVEETRKRSSAETSKTAHRLGKKAPLPPRPAAPGTHRSSRPSAPN